MIDEVLMRVSPVAYDENVICCRNLLEPIVQEVFKPLALGLLSGSVVSPWFELPKDVARQAGTICCIAEVELGDRVLRETPFVNKETTHLGTALPNRRYFVPVAGFSGVIEILLDCLLVAGDPDGRCRVFIDRRGDTRRSADDDLFQAVPGTFEFFVEWASRPNNLLSELVQVGDAPRIVDDPGWDDCESLFWVDAGRRCV
ncbi:hypothetical protein [Halosimplex pelagicum]|uniref:Uncharacterized protein n=1 Tax=Halosimplex pelagicum TaxID=869886 RepID=A0A7D5PEL6_9EURY|nr:hypothetical protein [Halosimplex pelagicum]QLH82220.1 hypothetical protein HZS54_11645 [Halosimplex pelagicum]